MCVSNDNKTQGNVNMDENTSSSNINGEIWMVLLTI
jgi:hypothetical protein